MHYELLCKFFYMAICVMTEKDKIIWNNIEKLLSQKRWTLARLAKEAQTRPQTINSIKTGERGIGKDLLSRFAIALNVDVAELLSSNSLNLCPVNCDLEMMHICKKVKDIRDSKSHWWNSLEQNINSFYTGLENDQEHHTGTQKPAASTGVKKRAG